ncbi:NUDIX hydrolase [Paenibacillus alkalitolerans]|uniref:NUDIX hydrolase n=1 Tax=Paenibacillus alkalitolerans TaxID=2799335 RepID=UPI0018F3C635|nr:NUDIX hydrolase [Paenibacillus alkalitolerans]
MSFYVPVSAKGIIINKEGKVLLLKNERNQWELPGGRIERGEQPEIAVVRELQEEVGFHVKVSKLINTWLFEVIPGRFVLIITYLCIYDEKQEIQLSDEHITYGWFEKQQLDSIPISEGYKKSIRMIYES